MKKIVLSFDTEPDLHSGKYLGITEGLAEIKKILDNNNIKATFFVTCDCIEKYPKIFEDIIKQGHEIALHGYRHERFDSISRVEKEEQIKKSILCFKKHLGINPKGFRAPQHSIDKETLNLLEKYNFKYDSSYHPLNFLQLIFFPTKIKLWSRLFFSPIQKYKIRKNLYELPPSSLFIPAASLIFRVFPLFLIKIYFNILKIFNQNIIVYFHSWDFIKIPKSRLDRRFPHTRVISNLDYLIKIIKNKGAFVRAEDLID